MCDAKKPFLCTDESDLKAMYNWLVEETIECGGLDPQ